MESPDLDLVPQKYKDAGLLPEISGSPGETLDTNDTGEPTSTSDEQVIVGGLADEDATSVRPNLSAHGGDNAKEKGTFERPLYLPGLRRDNSRQNEVMFLNDLTLKFQFLTQLFRLSKLKIHQTIILTRPGNW